MKQHYYIATGLMTKEDYSNPYTYNGNTTCYFFRNLSGKIEREVHVSVSGAWNFWLDREINRHECLQKAEYVYVVDFLNNILTQEG